MKIAAATNNGFLLAGHPGRCKMFLVYDIKDNAILNVEKRLNESASHDSHDKENCCNQDHSDSHTHTHSHFPESHGNNTSNCKPRHNSVKKAVNDCRYLLCSSAGQGLISSLNSENIEVILTESIPAESAVQQFIIGELKSDIHKICAEHNH
jgi:predicted Fe-Mo cluster-binding NifX family protein